MGTFVQVSLNTTKGQPSQLHQPFHPWELPKINACFSVQYKCIFKLTEAKKIPINGYFGFNTTFLELKIRKTDF